MLLVRPITLLFFLVIFCASLTQSENETSKAEKRIKMKNLSYMDQNDFFDGRRYISNKFSIYIKTIETIPPNPIENKTMPLLLIKFKIKNLRMESQNEMISWLECFQVEQGGKALDIADVSTSIKTSSKRLFNSETYDRNKGIIAYTLRNRKENVVLKAYKTNISKEVSVRTIRMINKDYK